MADSVGLCVSTMFKLGYVRGYRGILLLPVATPIL